MQLKYKELKILMEVLDDSFSLERRELREINKFYNSNKKVFNSEQTQEFLAYIEAKKDRAQIIGGLIKKITNNCKIEIKVDGNM